MARPVNTETTAVGAGLLAAVGGGLYGDLAIRRRSVKSPPAGSFVRLERDPRFAVGVAWRLARGCAAHVERSRPGSADGPARPARVHGGGRATPSTRRATQRVARAALHWTWNRFKQINDGFGHAVGDAVSARVPPASRSWVYGDDDVVARIGGEEFVILLDDTSLEGATRVAERIPNRVPGSGRGRSARRFRGHPVRRHCG